MNLENLKFTETKDYEKGFSDYFEKNVKHVLEPIEKFRLENLAIIKKRKPIFFLVLIAVLILISIFPYQFVFVLGGFGVFIAGYIVFGLPRTRYNKAAKTGIMPAIVKFFGDFDYSIDGKINANLNKFKIVQAYDRYTSEDYLNGKYKDVKIQSAETHLETRTTDSEGHTQYSTTFKGMFILIEMNKSFKGLTIIKTDSGKIGNWLRNKFSSLENIKLEDPKFEKLFECYGTDQVEGRYLLTTAFMERFLDLANIYGSKKIQASFIEKEIFIMIPSNKNLFEPSSINESIINIDEIHKFLAQMHYIFQIVDVLKMNQKIGM